MIWLGIAIGAGSVLLLEGLAGIAALIIFNKQAPKDLP